MSTTLSRRRRQRHLYWMQYLYIVHRYFRQHRAICSQQSESYWRHVNRDGFQQFGDWLVGRSVRPPQGVSNDDPAATEGYFIGVDILAYSLIQIRRISDPGGTPTISGNISLTVPATVYPLGAQTGRGVPYQGRTSLRTLDDLDDRLFQARILRDNVTGVMRLWTAQIFRSTLLESQAPRAAAMAHVGMK